MNRSIRLLGAHLLLALLLTGCDSLKPKTAELGRKAAFRAAQPVLEQVLLAEAPLAPSHRGLVPTLNELPGGPFGPRLSARGVAKLDKSGRWVLPPGDYVIPVMTFCMRSAGSSPDKHRYLLAIMRGKQADVLRDLKARSAGVPTSDVQVLSWAIQNGVAYENMAPKSKAIVDRLLPEHKKRLDGSWFKSLAQKWNDAASKFPLLPRFESVTDDALLQLGDVGSRIRELLQYRETIRRNGHDYARLRDLVELPGASKVPGTSTTVPWSRVADRVVARFLTDGHYGQIGRLEIRVLGEAKTSWNPLDLLVPLAVAESSAPVAVDPASWLGDPGTGAIQPLAFAAMAGAGVAGLNNPYALAALLAALAAQQASKVDWGAIFEALEKGYDDTPKQVRDLLDHLSKMAQERHNELEKGLSEHGILDGAKDTSRSPKNNTRQYEKEGGREQLQRDFDSLPYPTETAQDGTKIKTAPDGTKYSQGADRTPPVLEVQPAGAGKSGGDPTRIKVRYP